jgi:hypothetical protein
MIKQGSKGSLTLFYKDTLIASYPLTNSRTYDGYKLMGEVLILHSLKETGVNIKAQIYTYTFFCNQILTKNRKGFSIRTRDSELFLATLFALIKLKILDEDDCIFIQPRKRPKALNRSIKMN